MHGGEKIPLSMVRPCRIGVTLSLALDIYEINPQCFIYGCSSYWIGAL